MSLDRYWPTLANIDACIRMEAETVDPAVLLAVHEGGPLRVRAAGGATDESRSERDLLAELLRPADDGSAVVVAITGDSGVGKSHMIRWLHAQLQRHERWNQLVVVLVPKTASLRQVVERILEPLDRARYEHLQGELGRAVDSLTPDHASEMLAAALGNELDRRYQEGIESLRASNAATRADREQVDAARGLRNLLRDPGVRDRWFGDVLKRIIKQAVEGGGDNVSGEVRRFSPDDLATPDDWDPATGTEAARQYLQQLQSNDGARRRGAATVLQEVLDPALRTVFRFSEALGQKTIEEIVGDIRAELLAEGKELVLLIEDFAALAGIQQPLLNLMIAESDHQGRRIRAPLRTALAVTDGFLPSRQTILTRAKREWIIPSTAATADEIVLRLVDLAGRYLNAARWGKDALVQQYQVGTDEWVQPFVEPLSVDQAEQLAAFGKSRRGYPLFPLSRESIEALCRRELRRGAELIFNPRTFINHVLRDTLQLRPRYEQKAFPTAGFKDAVLPAAVDMSLRTQALSQNTKDRLTPLLVYWAGNPQDLGSSARVPKGVFAAFDLPWPFQGEGAATPAPAAVTALPSLTTPPPAPAVSKEKPGTPGLSEQIEAWANGQLLPQVQARHVRGVLAGALKDRLDWNGLRMRTGSVDMAQIWLPYAFAGNPNTEPKFVAGEQVRPLSATLRAGILALDRWHANGRSWDFLDSEDDYAVAQQLLDHLEEQATDWFAKVAERQAGVSLRVLHRQALMLRMTKAADPRLPPLADYESDPVPPYAGADPGDQSAMGVIAAARERAASALPDVRRALYDSLGCFQGTGSQLHAVDAPRLRSAWRSKEQPDDPQQIRSDLRAAREAVAELSGARISALIGKYQSTVEAMVAKVAAVIGADSDANMLATLGALIARAQRAGLIPPDSFSFQRAKRDLEFLSAEPASSQLRRARSFGAPTEDASTHARLAAWAEWDVSALSKTVDALSYVDCLLQAIEREAKAVLKSSGGGDIAVALRKLRSDLDELSKEGAA
jgi:hypothetical protein